MAGDIDREFRRIITLPPTADMYVGERLYIFASGHGIAPDVGDSAILTADASNFSLGNHIAARIYSNLIRTNGLFKEVALFMDCCRDILDSFPARPAPFRLTPTGNDSTHFFAFATRWSSKARESSINGRTQGLFTTALLAALRSGRIDGEQLQEYIESYLPTICTGKAQTPVFEHAKARDFIFSKGAAPAKIPVEVIFAPTYHGQSLDVMDGRFNSVHSAVASAAPWSVDLERGTYAIGTSGKLPIRMFDVVGQYKQTVTV